MRIDAKKIEGCLLGLAIGDAYGAPFEGGILERLLWHYIGKTSNGSRRFTDDTQMSIDIVKSFLERKTIEQDHLANAFAQSYKWSRGYGPSAAKLLKKIKSGKHWRDVNKLKYKEGSMGNGAAMRAPTLALCSPSDEEIMMQYVVAASEITHAHPLAIEGAKLIAYATFCALNGNAKQNIIKGLVERCKSEIYSEKMSLCCELLISGGDCKPKKAASVLGNGMLASESCVTSLFFALKYFDREFEELLQSVIKVGGDVDTIAAMSCAIWGASNGSTQLARFSANVESSEEIIVMAASIAKNI